MLAADEWVDLYMRNSGRGHHPPAADYLLGSTAPRDRRGGTPLGLPRGRSGRRLSRAAVRPLRILPEGRKSVLCTRGRIFGEQVDEQTFAEFVTAPEGSAPRKPAGLDFVEAASLSVAWLTAWTIPDEALKPGARPR